jgi:hypothetical protein
MVKLSPSGMKDYLGGSSSFIFLQSTVRWRVFLSMTVVTGSQTQVTTLTGVSCCTMTQCFMVIKSGVWGGIWLRITGGGEVCTGCLAAQLVSSSAVTLATMRLARRTLILSSHAQNLLCGVSHNYLIELDRAPPLCMQPNEDAIQTIPTPAIKLPMGSSVRMLVRPIGVGRFGIAT